MRAPPREALRGLDEGDVLEIHTADTEAIDNDIRAWCQATGNWLLFAEPDDAGRRYWIEKRTEPQAPTYTRNAGSVLRDGPAFTFAASVPLKRFNSLRGSE